MKLEKFKQLYYQHPYTKEISKSLNDNEKFSFFLKNLHASSITMFIASCFQVEAFRGIFVLEDKEKAAYFYNDLANLLGEEQVLFFSSSYKRSLSRNMANKVESANIILRTEVLSRFQSANNKFLTITYPEALLEKVVTQTNLENNSLQLNKGDTLSIEFIVEVLQEYEFQRVDFVYEPGQYSVRGGIVDIFSFSSDYPYRIDFFGDEVESIRSFDISSQLSKAKFNRINIVPNIQDRLLQENATSFFEFLPKKATSIWFYDSADLFIYMDDIFNNTLKRNQLVEIEEQGQEMPAEELFVSGQFLKKQLDNFGFVEFGNHPVVDIQKTYEFDTEIQPIFKKNFKLLTENLIAYTEKGYQKLILSENNKQIERLNAIFEAEQEHKPVNFDPVLTTLYQGFIDHSLRICCYTDHEIFDRYHKFQLRTRSQAQAKETLTLKELNNLNPGDYVVHVDHGIGRFGGLQKIDVNGKAQEAIRLVYKDNDILFVSIHSLHRISKYKGKDAEPPKIYKLGSGAWQKLKKRTKNKVKDIAKELIALYAKRKAESGFRFTPDSYLQHELESSFIYEDTPDQIKATAAVKEDMESDTPMDRLVCGDVGFGKTEIAIRAAFKAVADNKQVAVLVPTTILALQHYKTFKDRLRNFPATVQYISRLKRTKQQTEIKKQLAAGKVDILIGTHRLVGKDLKFKDLGLLVIDEEQKFGVSVKEKLKKIKVNVDTLTLTATPIPRTMQFSLMGARDLSIIQTPPPNRYPIMTELHTFNEDVIREAINYEISRGGQVFFIHNRVQNIAEVEHLINRICPGVRTVIAHGQMEGPKLEKIMLDFINEEYGVLIATTIIENGLDIPNANTIIVNNAQNFGLSELHQLRGRVGRTNKKAFCYLLAPPITVQTPDARRRLKAIENFSDLGSGFNIAMQDLDIRGAGNLLGGEQSGFIADIGFETYHRILNEALLELREQEYKDLFKTEQKKEKAKEKARHERMQFVTDCQIDTDLELLIPESYIENISERLKMYRELDNIVDEKSLKLFEEQLIDRFGKIPTATKELLDVVRLRWLAMDLGIEKIILKNGKMICYFVSNQESPYYQSPVFTAVLNFVQNNPARCNMKENKNKLSLSFPHVKNIQKAISLMKKIMQPVDELQNA